MSVQLNAASFNSRLQVIFDAWKVRALSVYGLTDDGLHITTRTPVMIAITALL